jgi:predicted lipoprotein with Yx(FWY)xxD motif
VSRKSLPALAGLALALVALGGCGGSGNSASSTGSAESSGSTGAATTPPATGAGVVIGVKHEGNLGSILYAGPNKLTVYEFGADHGATSACTGACASAWPPVTTSGRPTATGGAATSALGTTKREGGVEQVTYHGHPLYYYADDKTAATAAGQASTAFGAPWYVLAPSGSTVTTSVALGNAPPTTTEKSSTQAPKGKAPAEEKAKGGAAWG